MSLASLSVARPVFAWMLMLAIILFGVISFGRLGISQLPDVDFPVLSVSIDWEGAAPDVIEAELVDLLEQAIITVEGIKEISSTIRQGQASISVEFQLSRDVDVALQEVQSAISRVRLPQEVDPPTIRKSNPEDQPIVWVGVSSSERSLRELIDFIDRSIKDQFQILDGVGEIQLGGFADRSLRVWVDNSKLKKSQLNIVDVIDAVQRGHRETAAGIIENNEKEINLRVMGEALNPEDLGNVLITTRGGRPIYDSSIRINDVARIEDGLADIRRMSRINGTPGVGLGIKKQRGSNAVEVGERVKAKIEEFKLTLPKDIQIGVNFDSTVFVKESIEETEFTLFLSAMVTGIVCWLFLGSLRPTFNILLSIPTSIIGAFSAIYFFGFTLNFFTILALALAVGIVVDDAIMVLENIYRHRQMGKDRVRASVEGATEISFAAMAATAAVIAIFLPVAFMDGVIGKFFFQFGVTLSVAVILSLLEALTLTPMRCSQMLSDNDTKGFFERFIDSILQRLARLYGYLLSLCLRARWLVLLVAVGVFALSLSLLPKMRKEFIPPQDQSVFIVRFETPVGSSLEFTSEAVRKAEHLVRERKDVRRVYVAVGGFGGGQVNTGIMFVTIVPPAERALNQTGVMQEIREQLKQVPLLKVSLQDLSTRGFTAQRGFPVELSLRGAEWDVLETKRQQIMAEMEKTGLVVDLNSDYRLGQPEVRVFPDRDQAARRGVSSESISQVVSAAIGGIRQGKYTSDGRRYDVRIRLEGEERLDAESIGKLEVRNTFGELIPLVDIVKLQELHTLQSISRKNRERAISIYANLAEGKSQAEVLEEVERIARSFMPPGYHVVLGGGAQSFKESFDSLIFVLWLGVVVAYMVLAAQFNSYLDPLTVLVALPFSLTGAFTALYLSNQSINLFSMIGIILLMGIVKKNSILLVEFTNHKIEVEKLPLRQAILEAAPIRLRPILMTSAATLAAALPPALAFGPGAESRIPMSIAIVGGVAVSTFFTLFVVPITYSLMARLQGRR